MHEVNARFRSSIVPDLPKLDANTPSEAPTLDLAIGDLHHAATRIERAVEQAEAIADRYFGADPKPGATVEKAINENAATHDRLRSVIARINHAIDHLDDEVARLGRI